jgi:PIN domain nuclease of toxin-antitoxin system
LRILLDTHILLWLANDPQRLPEARLAQLSQPDVDLLFSAASIWEIAIKAGRHPTFRYDADAVVAEAVRAGIAELPVTARHAARVGSIASVHQDPFDRLLLVQAMTEPAILLTSDQALLAHGYPAQAP